jgi:dTDP-4-amino-4,6-dideoxygalactose transaminase
MTIRIPFNKPSIVGPELNYLTEAVNLGHASGDGPFTRRAQTILEHRFGSARALLTTSCTSALELAALLCDLRPGDEVIMPSYTFVSTPNAVVLRGAVPIFVDIRPDTLNIDENLIEAAITPRTRM